MKLRVGAALALCGVACTGGPSLSSDGGAQCASQADAGYVAAAQAAPAVARGACTPAEIQAFADACFGAAATSTTCDAWQTSEADAGPCLACIVTLRSAPSWGPLVCAKTGAGCALNVPGCVDVALGQLAQERQAGGAGSCGDLLSDEYGCQDFVCAACSTSGAPSSDFDRCAASAVAGPCGSFARAVSAAAACDALRADASGAAARCFPQAGADILSFVNLFCGAG